MANDIPPASEFTGLTAKVIAYSEAFQRLVNTSKQRDLTEADWAEIEQLVDVDNFQRMGVFLTGTSETFGWQTYKSYVSQFGKHTDWEGTLRRATENGNLVVLELEERNTHGDETDVSNTVTIYRFTDAGKLDRLDVYVSHLEKRPAKQLA